MARERGEGVLKRNLQIAGAFLVFLSIVCALLSTYVNSRVMGKAALGVGVYAPEEGSPEWNAKVRMRWWADALVYLGLLFAMGSLALQVAVILLPDA